MGRHIPLMTRKSHFFATLHVAIGGKPGFNSPPNAKTKHTSIYNMCVCAYIYMHTFIPVMLDNPLNLVAGFNYFNFQPHLGSRYPLATHVFPGR